MNIGSILFWNGDVYRHFQIPILNAYEIRNQQNYYYQKCMRYSSYNQNFSIDYFIPIKHNAKVYKLL